MGFSVATTVIAAAVNQDLTDLATVKDELEIKTADGTKDTWLKRAITSVSAAIANECERTFAPECVSDTFDIDQDAYPYQTPGGFAQLQLTRWPVLAILSVLQKPTCGQPVPLTEGVDFRTNPATGELLRLNPFTGTGSSWEAAPVTVTYVAGYGVAIAEEHAVPAAPYQVTVSQSAAFSCDQAVIDASGAALKRVAANPAAGQYSVAAGVYAFNQADTAAALTFSYGVKAIPADLVDICLQLISGRYAARGRDPALVQRETPGVGMERWWFGGAPGQKGAFPPDIEAALDRYNMPVVV